MDDATIIAWIDGELDPQQAEAVAAAVAADPALAAKAETHRRLKARIASAFGPLLAEPVVLRKPATPPARPAPVISLAEARAERQQRAEAEARAARKPGAPRWALGAIAASLLVGVIAGHQILGGAPALPGQDQPEAQQQAGIGDRPGALALAPAIASALDTQAAGQAGPIRVALSFRDKAGAYCRTFSATNVGGIACRGQGGWQLRYAAPGASPQGDYRMAGGDPATMQVAQAMMAGDPLDAAQEQRARAAGWK